MKVVDIADMAFRQIEPQDSSFSISSIAFWIRTNLGQFSDLIQTPIVEGDDFELNPTLTNSQCDLMKSFFFIYYYRRKVMQNLGAAAMNSFSQIKEGDRTVMRTSKTSIAQIWKSLLNDAVLQFNNQLASYLGNVNGGNINQVVVTPEFFNDCDRSPISILSYTRLV